MKNNRFDYQLFTVYLNKELYNCVIMNIFALYKQFKKQ